MGGATLPKNRINNNQTKKPSARAVKSGRKKMKNFRTALNEILERKGMYILDTSEYGNGHITATYDVFAHVISVSVCHRGKYNFFLSKIALKMINTPPPARK